VRPVHDRMPVILQLADYAAWLGAQTKAEDLKALLKPLPEDLMERYRVSRRMSNARNEGKECNGAILWRLTFPIKSSWLMP
jgi:putative SOS response-associated peptidase YedK